MRALIQRVSQASVQIDGQVVASCERGLLILLGVTHDDAAPQVQWMADKLCALRIFPDDDGKMNRSLQDDGLAAVVVSQFTLYADTRRGRRPGFSAAAPPELAQPLYDKLCDELQARGVTVGRGVFGADMQVHLVNDGPVTLILDTP